MAAMLAGLAVPSYLEALEKRQVTNDAERVAAFVSLARSESIKRFDRLTVSYAMQENGDWCIGSQLGEAPCDCTETDASAPGYCAIEGRPWILHHGDLQSGRTVRSLRGDGAYTFDPVRGILVDPEDFLVLALSEDVGRYEVELRVRHAGMPQLCVPAGSKPIEGLDRCSPRS